MLREQASQSNRRTAYSQGAYTSGGMPAMHRAQTASTVNDAPLYTPCALCARHRRPSTDRICRQSASSSRGGRGSTRSRRADTPSLHGTEAAVPSCREGKMMRLLAPTCRPKVLPHVAGAWPSASPSPPCPASASAQPCPACSQMRWCVDRVADTTRTGAYLTLFTLTAGSMLG